MTLELTTRQRRWLDALVVLATIALAFVVLGYLGEVFYFFGDVILVFFLAWLLAFILSPLVNALTRIVPGLNRVFAVVIVYAALVGLLVLAVVLLADAITRSITQFIASVPTLRDELPTILDPWQRRLNSIGLGQIDLVGQAQATIDNLNRYATELVAPLQQVAVASLGALGNVLLVFVLSLYMVVDRDRIMSFFFRVVPPAHAEEARLLETSVARSFGGFLRGQAVMGFSYALVAVIASAAFNLEYLPVTATLSGILMAIPFFGPFAAWAPPVLVAIVLQPAVTLPTLAAMAVGWLIVMNVLQPRIMESAVGIHPIVVIGSVLVGSRIAGITGAVFAIPIAAVFSAFFFFYLGRFREPGTVATRAARRLEVREGRQVRIPREPAPGVDPDVDESAAMAHRTTPPGGDDRRPQTPVRSPE